MNRIATAVERVRARLADLDPEKVAELDKGMSLEAFEHFEYQNVQARAHVEQTLTTEEAQTIYVALGEVGSAANGGWAEGTDTATKVAVTQAIGELLTKRVKEARRAA